MFIDLFRVSVGTIYSEIQFCLNVPSEQSFSQRLWAKRFACFASTSHSPCDILSSELAMLMLKMHSLPLGLRQLDEQIKRDPKSQCYHDGLTCVVFIHWKPLECPAGSSVELIRNTQPLFRRNIFRKFKLTNYETSKPAYHLLNFRGYVWTMRRRGFRGTKGGTKRESCPRDVHRNPPSTERA